MEATLCNSANTTSNATAVIAESAKLVTTNDSDSQIIANNFPVEQKKPLLEEQSSLKLKRCRHGRIIVKDLSKKKIVQHDDRETNQLQLKSTTTETKDEVPLSDPAPSIVEAPVEKNCELITAPINLATPLTKTPTDALNQSPTTLESEKNIDIKVDKNLESKEKSSNEVDSNSKRIRSKSPDRRTSRSRTSPRRQSRSNRIPSHRKSPRRDRDLSPRRPNRSRSPRSAKSSRKLSSSRRHRSPRVESRKSPLRHRSPRIESRNSPLRHRVDRQSYRNRSPRRRRSHSRSSGRFRNASRSPRREVDDREGDSDYEKKTRRRDVFDNSSGDLSDQLITGVSRAINSSQPTNSETPIQKQSVKMQEGVDNTTIQNHNHNNSQSNQPAEVNDTHKSSQQEDSPREPLLTHSSPSPSTNDSASSDIYDPEGPVLPISPGDSPPSLSSVNKAANNNLAYLIENERNDDDMPSSAVQLNHQEKYLQKLNRQERVVEEVKLALKPHYQRRALNKDQYKDVLRRAVPKVCHSKNGEINPIKIRALIDAYVKKLKRHSA